MWDKCYCEKELFCFGRFWQRLLLKGGIFGARKHLEKFLNCFCWVEFSLPHVKTLEECVSASYRPPLAMARYDLATTEQLMAHLRFNIVKKKNIYHNIFILHLSNSSKLNTSHFNRQMDLN